MKTLDVDEFNWEVLLRTDEAIYVAISVLKNNNSLYWDECFFISLIEFYTNLQIQNDRQRKGLPPYSIKQSQGALTKLLENYLTILRHLYYRDRDFRKYINSIPIKNEELLETINIIPDILYCPICTDQHKLSIPTCSKNIIIYSFSITCDQCHTTIKFLIKNVPFLMKRLPDLSCCPVYPVRPKLIIPDFKSVISNSSIIKSYQCYTATIINSYCHIQQ